MPKTIVKGITWAHSRGITPLLAAAQRFSELYPDIEFEWKKRTLQEFADYPIEKLVHEYDLLIIDHPWVGCAAETGSVLPLDKHLSNAYISGQAGNSVGDSHQSYFYKGHQWALAIDAATPAASYRADLLETNRIRVPETWGEVISLARRGKVAVPAIPIDLLMNFYSFCIAHGEKPFSAHGVVISHETGLLALETMRELYSLVNKTMFRSNPIAVAEMMTSTDNYWYCPFAYCYSNYARKGYADHVLTYSDLVHFNNSGRLRSTIGGTGLAVSAYSRHQAEALMFAEKIASPSFQSSFYVQHGGQPGHRAAWVDDDANRLTNNFFRTLLPVMDNGYMRPRYNGYLHFQDHAGNPIHAYLLNGGNPEQVLAEINGLYRKTLPGLTSLNHVQ